MKPNCYRQTVLLLTTIGVAMLGALVQSGCMPLRSDAAAPQPAASTPAAAPRSAATSAGGSTVVKGADTGYYFDSANKLVAVEALDGLGREIESSDMFANEDGLTLVMKSTCQDALPAFDGETEMVGKASTVVYAISSASVLVVLAVEDLTDVPSRKFVPMKPLDEGGVCCCTARRCGPVLCCPCNTLC